MLLKQEPQLVYKKGVIKNFAKFSGKHLQGSFSIKLQASGLLKKRLWHRCFSWNFTKFLRIPFLQEYLFSPLVAASDFNLEKTLR